MIGRTVTHYEILSQLGAGGMGVVYKAKDHRLGRLVALKFLPPQLASDEELKQRFVNEARAASALDHANICTIHEIDESEEGQLFIAMAFYEGQSLQERIARGPLSPVEALDIGIQVAEGLRAAHERGILHRDIKPGNIFVTQGGGVKILDFGLAKVSGATRLTRSGTSMGTLSYMPPEQLRGEAVDQRSDLFSLGAVLYEMLVGQAAFCADNEGAVVNRVLNQDPAPPSSRRPGLTPDMDRVVATAMAKDPEERCASAAALKGDLEALRASAEAADERPTLSVIPGAPARAAVAAEERVETPVRSSGRWRRGWVVGVAGTLIVLLAIAAPWWRSHRRETPTTEDETLPVRSEAISRMTPTLVPERVLVAPFENRTGEPSLSSLGLMASDWITRGLAQTGLVEAVSPLTAASAARFVEQESGATDERERIAALAEETGAGTVITGAIYRQGEDLLLAAQVTDTITMRLLTALEPSRGTIEEPLAAVEKLQTQVMASVATHLDSRLTALGRSSELPSYEAYSEYSKGLEQFIQMDFRGAANHWTAASAMDPSFVQPLLPAAMAYVNLSEWAEADELIRRVEPHRSSLSVLDQLLLDRLVSTFEHDYDGALEAMRRSAELNPQGPGAFDAGALALATNRPREALNRLEDIDFERGFFRGFAPYWHFLTEAYHLVGAHGRELEAARLARQLYPNLPSAVWWEMRASVASGDFATVRELMEVLANLAVFDSTPGSVMMMTAGEAEAHGYQSEARDITRAALDWYDVRIEGDSANPGTRDGRARALVAAARYEEAEAEFRALVAEHPDSLSVMGYLGLLAAQRGDDATAGRMSGWLEKLDRPYLWGEHVYWQASIAAWGGDLSRAMQLFRNSIDQGRPMAGAVPPPHSDLVLKPLWGYPPFQEFIEPTGR